MSAPRYAPTQPFCTDCYSERFPGLFPVRIGKIYRETETCCDCGGSTRSGIYARVDARDVPHPTNTVERR